MSHFTVDPKRFDVFKELLARQLHNFRAEQPYSHAVYYGDVLLDNMVWTKEEMAEALGGQLNRDSYVIMACVKCNTMKKNVHACA